MLFELASLSVLLASAAGDSAPSEPPPSEVPTTRRDAGSPPPGAFPPPVPRGIYRDLSLSLSLGPGWLALRDDLGRDGQSALALAARMSTAIRLDWAAHLGVEHVTTERGGSTFSQTVGHLGIERYFLERVYLSGAVGLAWVRESRGLGGISDGPGFAYHVAVGGEVLQGDHVAVTAELAFTMGHYSVEKWEMGGLRLGLALY